MSRDLAFEPVYRLADRIRTRDVGCEQVSRLMLERIAEHNPLLNCYLKVFEQTALDKARDLDRELDAGRYRGALHGVPIAIKDIFDFPGHHASGGSRLKRDSRAETANLVSRLEDAGAVLLGVLNLDELAAGGSGDNLYFGRCKNPWNPEHNTGGSSGGSACAVAAGLAYASIGSDAGGSVRLPAAFCGVVGLKPTYGLVSRYGALARGWSVDCIGPLARDANDIALVLQAIAGADPNDPSSVPVSGVDYTRLAFEDSVLPRLGLVENALDDERRNTDPALFETINRLAEAGCSIKNLAIPDLDKYTGLHQVLVKCEAAAIHGQALRNADPNMSHAVRSVIADGLEIPAVAYIEAASLRRPLLQSFSERVMTDVDLLAMPVSLPCAPRFESQQQKPASEVDLEFSRVATMTRFANYLGLPAISIPTGVGANGLPTAIQLVARVFDEPLLLKTAALCESLRGPLCYPGESI